MKNAFWIILLIVIILGAVSFANRGPENKSDYIVKVGYLPIMSSKLPFEIAKQKGFFEEAGVKIEATEIQSSNLLADAIIRGDIDVIPRSSLIPLLTAELVEPGKVKIFAVTDYTSDKPFDSIIVKEESPIKTIEDLKGKKIGVFTGTTAKNFLKLLFKSKGIDYSTVQFVELPPQQHLTALTAGSIDALYTYEPSVSIGKDELKARVIFGSVFAYHLEHNPLGGSQINSEFAKQHPEEAKRIIEALNKASDYMRSHDAETRKIAQEIFKFNDLVASQIVLPYSLHSNNISPDRLNTLVDLFVSAGELKEKPDLSNIFYK